MNRHDAAAAMIETRLLKMEVGDDSIQLSSETDMATEMAYAQGDIDCSEYQGYVERRHRARTRHFRNQLKTLGVPYDNAACAVAH